MPGSGFPVRFVMYAIPAIAPNAAAIAVLVAAVAK